MGMTKHKLVPKHTKLSDAEKEKLLKNHNVDLKLFPKILFDDLAIVKLNLKIGDVVKIERASQTAGDTVYYRVVAEN